MNNKALTAEEMKAIDINASYLGIKRILLMENAGSEVARQIRKNISIKRKKITIVSGTGDKGGDGFVAARHLTNQETDITIILLGEPERIKTKEAKENWEIIEKMEESIKRITIKDSSQIENIQKIISESDIIVDALLGTGIRGKVRPPAENMINMINQIKKKEAKIISIDIPSGINPNSGEMMGTAIKADYTITHHKPKMGLIKKAGQKYSGKIIISNIGIPREAEIFTGPGDVYIATKRRKDTAHKGDFGRILVIGGSIEYTGAPALSALSALITGADLVTIVTPNQIANTIRGYSPNIIVKEYTGKYLNEKGVKLAIKEMKKANTILIGPGLSYNKQTKDLSRGIIREAIKQEKNLVIDADALKACSKNPMEIGGPNTIITPHAGEFKILTGIDLPKEEKEGWKLRAEIIEETANKLNTTIILKAHYDIISNGIITKINRTGNPGMTVGGTGDVLAGVTATFLTWTNNTIKAATVAAFINGLAGDLAAEEKGYHITATDVIKNIPKAFKEVRKFTLS